MPFRTLNFSDPEAMDLTLNGGVMGGVSVASVSGKVMGLHGLTLIVRTTTVTFSDATGAGLTLAQIKTAVQAVAGVTASWSSGRLMLKHVSGVTVDKDGTANSIFGFDGASGVDTVGVVYAPPSGAAPRVLFIGRTPAGDGYFVTAEV